MDKIIDPNFAARAYTSTSAMPTSSIPVQNEVGGKSFQEFVTDSLEESMQTMKTGEQMQAAAVRGEADITEVVQAVSASEITLDTIVTLRDRMISAYQEIMRMPI
ncbi:MAG: flagellar hook-basal body complex protein FliE [Alphaproteobacteria bacterium]